MGRWKVVRDGPEFRQRHAAVLGFSVSRSSKFFSHQKHRSHVLFKQAIRKFTRTGPPVRFEEPPSPVSVRHAERSYLFSADDDPGRPTPELIELALKGVREAMEVELSDLSGRITSGVRYPEVWPGEHYKLLAGFVRLLAPRLVIEIGTATGMSALAMKKYLPQAGRLVTYDLVDWREYPEHLLTEDDFEDGRLSQHLIDLSDPAGFHGQIPTLRQADLIFVDAAKDGEQEQRFLDHFERCPFEKAPLVIFDDIRLWNMLRIWRQITRPKLDLTSFGHWSGTGLILWENRPA
jgi:predicted O-methyltransferase YrrM